MTHGNLRGVGQFLILCACACTQAGNAGPGSFSRSRATPDVPWRTASWNTCQTSLAEPDDRPECRAKINPDDASRTASEVERLGIGNLLLARDMYSFALQEVCERDVRWIAAYVANQGNVGPEGTFTPQQYAAIDSLAPYAFLPYLTSEIIGEEDHGCGPGVSTGIGIIVKNRAGAPAPKIRGLSNADYLERLNVPFTYARLQASACDFYFEAQADRRTGEGDTQFRSNHCSSEVSLDTLRGLACVQTSWRASRALRSTAPLRATSCVTHPIGGRPDAPGLTLIAGAQIWAAGHESMVFTEGRPLMLAGDFNSTTEKDEILGGLASPFIKVTEGPSHRFRCRSEIDGIYVRGWSAGHRSTTNCEPIDMAFPDDLGFGDFDGDGITDVFHRRTDGQWRYSSGGVEPWRNLNHSVVPGNELAFGDFDGDGITDVFHRRADGQWRYSSGGVDPWRDLNHSDAPGDELGFGDFDGDGITDVFYSRPSADGSPNQWLYSSGGIAPWKELESSSIPFTDLRLFDFDGDGLTDVFYPNGFGIWRYSSGGSEGWQFLEGGIVPLDTDDPFSFSDHAMLLSPRLRPAGPILLPGRRAPIPIGPRLPPYLQPDFRYTGQSG